MIVLASHNHPLQDAHLIAQRRLIHVQNVNGFQDDVPPNQEHDRFIRALAKRAKAEAARGLRAHLGNVKTHLQSRLKSLGGIPAAKTSARA